jgi:ComF family protein
MFDKPLSFIAPHHCCGCDKIGTLLCADCKFNIVSERIFVCVVCHKPTSGNWVCVDCKTDFSRAWVVNERNGALQRLVGLFKFERAKSAYRDLGDLVLEVLPDLPAGTVMVPIPTTSARIRERGYDHVLLIAKYVAKARGAQCAQLIARQTDSKQRQMNAKQRAVQAKNAFCINGDIDPEKTYLIIDDVITTGATIKYASRCLKRAGAKNIWVAIIARQTLG